jgi:uncharacterized protein
MNGTAVPVGTNGRPGVHKFRTQRNHYVFDVNTGRIIKLDPATWDVLDHYGRLDAENLARLLAPRHSPEAVRSSCEAIAKAQAQGSLLPSPAALTWPDDAAQREAREAVEHKRHLLTLCATEACNLRCTYCIYGGSYDGWPVHSGRKMPWDVARRAIDDYIEHSDGHAAEDELGSRYIGFYGGEPLLNMALIHRVVAYGRKRLGRKVAFNLTTNGLRLRGAAARFLAQEQIDLTISLDGPQHLHDACRRSAGGKGTWRTVIGNVRRFLQEHPRYRDTEPGLSPLTFATVLPPMRNALEVEQFFRDDLPELLGCHPTIIVRRQRPGSRRETSIACQDRTAAGWATLRQRYMRMVQEGAVGKDPRGYEWRFPRSAFDVPLRLFVHRRIGSGCSPLPAKAMWNSLCMPGHTRMFVDVEGGYYPCERVPTCRDLRIGSVDEGLRFDLAYGLKKKLWELCRRDCPGCWCVNFCHPGCYENIRDGDRMSAAAKGRCCEQHRQRTHELLVGFCEVAEENPAAFDYLKTDQRPDTHGD